MSVSITTAQWRTHADALRRIREVVFIQEQGVSRQEEWDGLDDTAQHFIALDSSGHAVGTARLLDHGQIGRMAVLASHRGTGVGMRLLQAAVAAARTRGMDSVHLHAQVQAEPFYRKAGFDRVGEQFMEAGIPHIEMRLLLPVQFTKPSSAGSLDIVNPDHAGAMPDRTAELLTFDDIDRCRGALDRIIGNARRELIIASPTLDAALFGRAEVLQSISNYIRRTSVPTVRVLVDDARAIASAAHPLLQLAQRLPSRVLMRRQPRDIPEGTPLNYVVADAEGFWVIPERDTFTGFANAHDRVESRRLLEVFNHLFERATEDPDLRRLAL